MSTANYQEFGFLSSGAGNGESGVGLAETFLQQVATLENVKRICDLGCGNGYISGLLASRGYEVVGIDASQSGTSIARERYPDAQFICSLIDETMNERLRLEQFDLVVSSDVIEHMYRPSDLVVAAASMLRPGGELLLGTPYHGYWKNLALAVSGKLDSHFNVLDDGGHIKFFSVKTLSQLVTRHSFTDLKFTYYGRAPWLWMNMLCYARKAERP